MAAEHHDGGDISEISSITDSSDEGKKVVEEVVEAVEEDEKPAYSEEDLETLVGFIRGMIILFDYEDEEFNEEVAEVVKLWLTDVNIPLLFIFYDGDRLSATLAFPLCPINDLMYFMREPDQLFNVMESFHDDIMFGTLHKDIEGSLLVLLEQVYGPMILSNTDWSENVKTHVINGFNSFMTYLTELHYKLSGFTLLYVPREGSDMEVQEVVLNRSMIKRLEAVVIDWTSKIRSMLGDTQHFVPDDLVCPADEYSFWLYRLEVLSAVKLQHQGPNVQHIVKVLELAQSLYIKHLKDALCDLETQIEVAESNIPFLKLLVNPCSAIEALDNEDELCEQLIYIIHIIHFIGANSQYLCTDESITKLFLYLSNEIVSCCMRAIDIEKILAGAPRYGIEVCNLKINFCESYKIIYEEMLEHYKQECSWNLDYAAIFNRINAFLQRLSDILEICDAMLIFGRYADASAYTAYRFFCNNAVEFERRCEQVEKIFHSGLSKIEAVSTSILDINNKGWYQHIADFREMLKNLDDIIENLLSNVFVVSENLEEKLNVLVTLLNFYKRDNIKNSYMRKVAEVWSIFRAEITELSKEISAGINQYPSLLPQHAGRYATLKAKWNHLTRLEELIVSCRFFPEYPEQEQVLELYEACERQIKVVLKGFNDGWCKSVTNETANWYNRNLICRSQLRPGLFECHIERSLLLLFEEAHYFKTLAANVPGSLDLEKHDNTKLTFDNVLRLVLYYNSVVSSISDKERLFFKPMIQQTERKLEPLRSRFVWDEDLSEVMDNYVTNVKDLLDSIQLYKRENLKISELVEQIYCMILLELNLKQSMDATQLMDYVTNQRRSSFRQLIEVYTEVSKNIFTIFDNLGSNVRKMGDSWEQYLRKIDNLLKMAIFTCSMNTLAKVRHALENVHGSPILSVEVLLKGDGIVFEPDLQTIEKTMHFVPTEVCSIIKTIPSMSERYRLEDIDKSFYLQLMENPQYIKESATIESTVDDTVQMLQAYQEKWNVFRPFWCVDKEAFIEKFKLSTMTSEAFQRNIEKFEELLNQLSMQGDLTVCKCIEIDAQKLKYAITGHINEWQRKYIEYLKSIAYGKIIEFNNVLRHNIAELRVEPLEVFELKRLEERYQACHDELPDKELEIETMLKYFVVLERYVTDLLPEAYELRQNIDVIWAQYQADLKAIKEQIENYQDQFKLSMTGAADALKVDALEMLRMLREEMPSADDLSPDEAFEAIDRLMMQLEELERREREIDERMRLLGVDYVPLPAIKEIRSKLEHLRAVWVFVEKWRDTVQPALAQEYHIAQEADMQLMATDFRATYRELNASPIGDEGFDVFRQTGEAIEHFFVIITILVAMKTSFLQKRHWQKVKDIAKREFEENQHFSIGSMMELQLYHFEDDLLELCYGARREHEVELELDAVSCTTKEVRFNIRLLPSGFYEVTNAPFCFATLSQTIGTVSRLRTSPYRHPFQPLINYWEVCLGFLEECLEILMLMEHDCRLLLELYKTAKQSESLDSFNSSFRSCFAMWRTMMQSLSSARLLDDICPIRDEFTVEMETIRKRFEELRQDLRQMLDERRHNFHRFHLLSDEQLIKLIAFPTRFELLEEVFRVLYENVARLELKRVEVFQKLSHWQISGVHTADGEYIAFAEPLLVAAKDSPAVDTTMREVDLGLQLAIRDLLTQCHTQLRRKHFKRIESGWLKKWPLQLCLKSADIQNTLHTKNALLQCGLLGHRKPLNMLRSLHDKLLQELTSYAHRRLPAEGNGDRWTWKKLNHLLIVEINARDLIERLCRLRSGDIAGLQTFEWVVQLHSYLIETTKDCRVSLVQSIFSYGYECKRSDAPIFITPSSEKAILTTLLTVANGQVPLLTGTAACGRKSLLRSLSHSLGVLLVIVNCDEGWTTTDVTRFTYALAILKGWLCFTNMHVLPPPLLTVVGDYVKDMHRLTRHRMNSATEGRTGSKFAFFGTCLPEYRNEYDRSLYRPVNFVLADRWIVIELMLWMAGFSYSRQLANILETFVGQIELWLPEWYRAGVFGMQWLRRLITAMKLRLQTVPWASEEKHSCSLQDSGDTDFSEDTNDRDLRQKAEEEIAVDVLQMLYEQSLSEKEMVELRKCINTAFGIRLRTDKSTVTPTSTESEITEAMQQAVSAISGALADNHVMVTGDACSGKTTAWRAALDALKKRGIEYETYCVTPNALRKATDPSNFDREWFDEILLGILKSGENRQKCVIFDSIPNDRWIPCILTLPQYRRTDFTQEPAVNVETKVLVETSTLESISPSTVSHFTIVHLAGDALPWRSTVAGWLDRKHPFVRGHLDDLFESHYDTLLAFRRTECPSWERLSDVTVTRTFCQLCDSTLAPFNPAKQRFSEPRWTEALKKVFFFCAVWSLGGCMDESERTKFDLLLREQHPEAGYPVKGNVFLYRVDVASGAWVPWECQLPGQGVNSVNDYYQRVYVRSTETIPYEYVTRALLEGQDPVLLASDGSVGKTALVKGILDNLNPDEWSNVTVAVTRRTTVHQMRRIISCQSVRATRARMYPSKRRDMLCFWDDLHVANGHVYGLDDFMRHFLEHKSWHSGTATQSVQQVHIIAAMRNIPCDTHSPTMKRLINRFHFLYMAQLSDEQYGGIFATMLSNGFPHLQSNKLLKLLAPATVDFLRRLSRQLPPTPYKQRYQFSLKTVATVVRAFCLHRPEDACLADKTSLLRYWIHECFRETWDRLDRVDYKRFYELFNDTISAFYEVTLHGLCPNNRSPVFTDVLDGQRRYQDVRDTNQLITHAEARIVADHGCPPTLVHRDAIESAAKVLRAMRLNRPVLLVGDAGSGRATVCQIAAQLSNPVVRFHRIDVSARDTAHDVDRQFSMLFRCCNAGRTLCLVNLSDNSPTGAALNERTMELLNGVSSGEDLAMLCYDLQGEPDPSTDEARPKRTLDWRRIRANLHAVLCISFDDELFRLLAYNFPSLLASLTVCCIHDWPEATLLEISKKHLLKNVPLNVPILAFGVPGESTGSPLATTGDDSSAQQTPRRRESLIQSTEERLQIATHDLLFRIHYSVLAETALEAPGKRNIIVPYSWYLELLDTFKRVLEMKRRELQAQHRKFRIGIERIEDATERVAQLSDELEQRQREIAQFQEQVVEFLGEIESQTKEADEQKEEVSIKREKIGAEEVVCKQLAAAAEADLQKAMPALNAAVAALDSLNKKDMNEIKSYSRPPTKVELVLEAVMILLDKEPTWVEAKRQLGEQKFLETLKNFDRNNISERTLKIIGSYVKNPDLEPNKVGVVSKAAKSLILWVRAIENYGKVYRYVGPKIRKMEDANASLLEKQNALAEAERKLQQLAEKLNQLRAEYEEKLLQKQKLEEVARQMAAKLERARNLVGGLANEKIRWMNTKEGLELAYARLVGDSTVAAGCLTYFGAVNMTARAALRGQWLIELETMEIQFSPNFSLAPFFYDPDTMQRWREHGLPPDDFSAENATIILNSVRIPLIVDPQQEARGWLLQEVAQTAIHDFDDDIPEAAVLTTMEKHLPLVIENVHRRNSADLQGLFDLRRKLVETCRSCQSGRRVEQHRIYLVCREGLTFSGAMRKCLTTANFLLGPDGLEMKLLGILVRNENPSLEERKETLGLTISVNKRTLTDLEENILRILNESQTPLLENEELYQVLQTSKKTFEAVSTSLTQAESTKREIENSREIYRSCASRATVLFLVVNDLQHFNTLYSFSLEWYKNLFLLSLEKSGRVQVVEERKRRIDEYHTFHVFKTVCRSLFENDRKLFAFYLCVRLLFEEESLSEREYKFLLYGAGKIDRQEQTENPGCDWLSDPQWDNITDLDKLPGFHGIVESFCEITDEWHDWYLSAAPERTALPETWEKNLKQFQKYLVVRCLRLDRIEVCMRDFVKSTLGTKFVDIPSVSLEDVYEESSPQELLLLILQGDSNPTERLKRLASKVLPTGHQFKSINIIDDTVAVAVNLLKRSVADGNWLLINNCHLSEGFLRQLTHVSRYVAKSTTDSSEFRLWLATKPHAALPKSVYQNCAKITYEEPKGIKHSMRSVIEELGEAHFKKSRKRDSHSQYARTVYALAFLHALLLERNNFQQLGWSVPYRFTNNDFNFSEKLLKHAVEELQLPKAAASERLKLRVGTDFGEGPELDGMGLPDDELGRYDTTPWKFIQGAVLEMGYGAHIVSGWDRPIYDVYRQELFQCRILAVPHCPLATRDTRFRMPRDGTYQTYVNFIAQQLPAVDGIDVFGQHENANIKYLKSRSEYMLQMLTGMHRLPSGGGDVAAGSAEQDDDWSWNYDHVKQTVTELLSTLPVYLEYGNALRIVGANKTPVCEAMLHEILTYNRLVGRVRMDCEALMLTLLGTGQHPVLDDRRKQLVSVLQRNRVPDRWNAGLPPSMRPGLDDWVADLKDRVRYFRRWTETGQMPVDLLLGRFTNPRLFLNAVLKHYSKLNDIPFADLRWNATIFTTMKPLLRLNLSEGVIIKGLTLENGSWDLEKQTLLVPQILELTCPMPPIALRPVRRSASPPDDPALFPCPVFQAAHRSADTFVITIPLDVGEAQTKNDWIKYNTALLLNN